MAASPAWEGVVACHDVVDKAAVDGDRGKKGGTGVGIMNQRNYKEQ